MNLISVSKIVTNNLEFWAIQAGDCRFAFRFTHCSFCGKSPEHVDLLIAGPGVFICNECVDICNQIISGEIPPRPLTEEQVEKLLNLTEEEIEGQKSGELWKSE